MGEYIEADTGRMSKVANEIMSQVTKIKEIIKEIGDSMLELDADWDGVASMVFLNGIGQECEALSEYCEFMEKYCNNIELAVRYYQQNETSINDAILNI